MKNKTIYFSIIFVLFVSLGIFGLQKNNIANAQTVTFRSSDYTADFNVYLDSSRYSRGETASASIRINIQKLTGNNSRDIFSGTVTIAGKTSYFFSYVPVYSLGGYYQISAPVETTTGAYQATFTIARNGWQDTQQVTIPYAVYALTNWSSSDPSIVTIDEHGYAVAKAPGRASIKATYKDKVAYLDIVVSAPLPGDFTLSSGSASCYLVPLSWTASGGATAYRILRGSSRVDISPYQPYTAQNFTDATVSQNTTYQYQIEAYNAGGTKRSNEISVTTPYCPPTISLSANPTSIYQGQSSTLSWTTTNAVSCNASASPAQSDWSGIKPSNNTTGESVKPSPPLSVTYTLFCSGPGGTVSQSVIINISSLGLPNWKEIIPR